MKSRSKRSSSKGSTISGPQPASGARLACGCQVGFRQGVEGSPVTVVVSRKASSCMLSVHVTGVPVYDHREALRPATRPVVTTQPDFEEN